MRIRRISIESIRSHTRRFDLALAFDAINILHGPNGSGKSSVLTALHHAFLSPHDSASAAIAALVPWGTSLAPTVEVDFVHRDTEFRLRKQFLHSPQSILETHTSGVWKPLAKSKQADARIREFLGAAADGKATQDRLLASVLWTQQGDLALSSVSPNVRSALAEQLDSPAAQRLLKWIEDQASTYWTPTGKIQKHSPAARLESELTALESRRSALQAELASIDTLRDEIVALESALDEAQSAVARAKTDLDRLGQSLSESTLLTQQRDSLAPLIAAKTKEVDLLSAAVSTVEKAQSELAALHPELEGICAGDAAELDARIEEANSKLAGVSEQYRLALAFRALQAERAALDARLAAIREAQAAIAGLEGELRGLNAPPPTQLARLKDLTARLAQLAASLESASLRLEVTPIGPIPIEIHEGDQPGVHPLDPGVPRMFTASPRLRFSIADVGEFAVTGPASSAAELKDGIAAARSERDALAASLGTSDIAELERRSARATEIEAHLKVNKAALDRELSGESESEIQSRLVSTLVALEAHYVQFPGWKTQMPDVEQIKSRIAPLANDAAGLADLRNRLSALTQSIESVSARLSETLARHGAASLDDLKRAESSLRTELAGLIDKMASVNSRISALPPDLVEQAQRLSAEVSMQSGRVQQTSQLLHQRRGQLEEKLSKAPASSLGDVEAELTSLTARLDRERLAAQAWRLLRDAAHEGRDRMLAGVATPVSERATEILASIGVSQLGPVQLTTALEPAPLSPGGAPAPVDLDQISGGEAEQVHFAARLALAELLARDEPQLVVFDDVLLSTDDNRLARMLELLESSLDRLQVLILTCHPERYRSRSSSPRLIGLGPQ